MIENSGKVATKVAIRKATYKIIRDKVAKATF